jgi:succinate dehydrogenase / fumarate reductase iron-sulfur subunit
VELILRIRRYNPEVRADPWWDESTVEMEPSDRLLDALHEVKWHQDGTLAPRRSCTHGICGSDAILVNGRNDLACKVLVKDVAPKVTVEPIRGLPVKKDPHRRHGAVLRGIPGRSALPRQRRGRR